MSLLETPASSDVLCTHQNLCTTDLLPSAFYLALSAISCFCGACRYLCMHAFISIGQIWFTGTWWDSPYLAPAAVSTAPGAKNATLRWHHRSCHGLWRYSWCCSKPQLTLAPRLRRGNGLAASTLRRSYLAPFRPSAITARSSCLLETCMRHPCNREHTCWASSAYTTCSSCCPMEPSKCPS